MSLLRNLDKSIEYHRLCGRKTLHFFEDDSFSEMLSINDSFQGVPKRENNLSRYVRLIVSCVPSRKITT